MSRDPSVTLLRDLIAIDSVNPSLVPGGAGEGAIGQAVAEWMRRAGFDVEKQEVGAGRANIIGIAARSSASPSLMFCGHLDTVGVEGMDAPFDPVERDGRVYGRGAQDMKGGLAAMLDAGRVLLERRRWRGRLTLAAVVDEEYASAGADALVTAWTADAAVVTEPTDLQIGIAHRGFAWLEVETRGRAAHGSRPLEGRDAIFRMGRVLSRLEALDRELQGQVPDPLLGTPSLHASVIRGGREWSSYPDSCRLQIERRTVAGEPDGLPEWEIAAILDALGREDPEFDGAVALRFRRPAYRIPEGHPLPGLLGDVLPGGRREPVGVSFWTDAAVLGSAGVPAVIFGPGGEGLHSPREYVRVADVLGCRNALADLAARVLQ